MLSRREWTYDRGNRRRGRSGDTGSRRVPPGAADRHDRGGFADNAWYSEQRRRGLPVSRLSRVRFRGELGFHPHGQSWPTLAPGLFTAWHADETNPNRWICTVRHGETFHDGSAFNAEAVIWNFRRIYDDKSPQYDAPAAPIVRATVSMIDAFEMADDKTVVLTTKYPFSFLPYLLTRLLIASPTQWDAAGKNWAEFAKKPSGTGPFKITKVVPGQYAEMSRNEEYWDKARVPKLEKMVVYPMPGIHHAGRRFALGRGLIGSRVLTTGLSIRR